MIELRISVANDLVESLGQKSLEKRLEDYLQKLVLKMAAKDILTDLKEHDLSNDPQWQIARDLAWKSEKDKYIVIAK